MNQNFINKHQKTIDAVIRKNPVVYTTSAGGNTACTVHGYYISSKNVTISTYAIKNKINKYVSKYIVKITIASDKKNQKSYTIAKDTAQFAKTIHRTLAEKHAKQIEKTQLNKCFNNGAFTKKR